MWDDFLGFLGALWEYWFFLAGGVVMLAVDLIERIRGKEINFAVLRWIGFLCVFVACFLAWRDERKKVQKLEEERPYFTDNGSGADVSRLANNPDLGLIIPRLSINLTNSGKRTAGDIKARLIVLDQDLSPTSPVRGGDVVEPVNPIEPGAPFKVFAVLEGNFRPENSPRIFAICELEYRDPSTGTIFYQKWFYSWGHVGETSRNAMFDNMDKEEKEKVLEYLKSKKFSLMDH